MQIFVLLFTLAAMTVISFYLGRQRALAVAGGNVPALNSLPGYYGYYMALWCATPALFIVMFWLFFESTIVASFVVTSLPEAFATQPEQQLNLVMNEIVNLARKNIAAEQASPEIAAAAQLYNQIQTVSSGLLFALVITLGAGGAAFAWNRIHVQQRARNKVERTVLIFLMICLLISVQNYPVLSGKQR